MGRAAYAPGMTLSDLPFQFPPSGYVSLNDPLVRQAIYSTHKGRDFWTRAPLDFKSMVLDHVFPASQGGPNHLWNLVPTHAEVNASKGDRIDPEGTVAVLSILRIYFAPAAARRLAKLKIPKEKEADVVAYLERNAELVTEIFNDPENASVSRQDIWSLFAEVVVEKGFAKGLGDRLSGWAIERIARKYGLSPYRPLESVPHDPPEQDPKEGEHDPGRAPSRITSLVSLPVDDGQQGGVRGCPSPD